MSAPPLPSRPAWILAQGPHSACRRQRASTPWKGSKRSRSWKSRTPFGAPSDASRAAAIGDLWEVVFPARPRRHHSLFHPSRSALPANLWALRSLGGAWILSCSAVGSLQGRCGPARHAGSKCRFNSSIAPISARSAFSARARCARRHPPILLSHHSAPAGPMLAEMPDATGRQLHRSGHLSRMEGPAFLDPGRIQPLPQLGLAR